MEKYPGYETSSKKEYDENKDVLGLNEVFRSKVTMIRLQPLFGKPDDVSGFGLNMVDGVLNIRDIGRYPVRDWRIVRGDAVPLWKPRSNHGSWEETARFPGRNADLDIRRTDETECICIPHIDLVEQVSRLANLSLLRKLMTNCESVGTSE
ncbi:hypothetical protein BJ742DRAFT_426572 [Cladochytrium replicatum]|nr:hypothetical protein BJ742DRAFT_426572 [Cladochytrium replicatum]